MDIKIQKQIEDETEYFRKALQKEKDDLRSDQEILDEFITPFIELKKARREYHNHHLGFRPKDFIEDNHRWIEIPGGVIVTSSWDRYLHRDFLHLCKEFFKENYDRQCFMRKELD